METQPMNEAQGKVESLYYFLDSKGSVTFVNQEGKVVTDQGKKTDSIWSYVKWLWNGTTEHVKENKTLYLTGITAYLGWLGIKKVTGVVGQWIDDCSYIKFKIWSGSRWRHWEYMRTE